MGFGAKVADKQNEGQVADFKAAGDDAHVGTLEVKTSLQSGEDTDLTVQDRQERPKQELQLKQRTLLLYLLQGRL